MLPSTLATDTVIYLLRHGATSYNLLDPPRLQGSGINVGLDVIGRAQAERAAHALAEIKFHAIYASPLHRANETAQMIAARHKMEIQHEADLREINVGRWEGKSWAMIEREDPEGFTLFRENPVENGYAGGENLRQLADRFEAAIQHIAARHAAQKLIVVAHGMANSTLISRLMGVPLQDAMKIPHDNCGINVIRIRDREMKLMMLNSTLHLRISPDLETPSTRDI